MKKGCCDCFEPESNPTIFSEEKKMGSQGSNVQQLYLLRGPLLIGVALLSVAISIAQSLSYLAILQLSLLAVGFVLVSYDSAQIGHNQLRGFLRRTLGSIVWDDIMYKFWHPDYDWWKVFVETFVGQASWMYILPSTSEQRVQLVQAALQVDEQEAQRILFAPGGYQRLLLPRTFVNWLEGENTNGYNNSTEIVVDASVVEEVGAIPTGSYSSVSSVDKETSEQNEDANDIGLRPTTSANVRASATAERDSNDHLPSMSETMRSIVIDTVSDQLRDLLSYAPDSKQLAAVGLTAGTALALQLRYSSRARRIAVGVLETSAMAGLSTISLGAAGLALAKTFGPGGRFPINEANIVAYISKVLRLRTSLRELSFSGRNKQDKDGRVGYKRGLVCAAVAILVLTLRRRHHARQLPTRRR